MKVKKQLFEGANRVYSAGNPPATDTDYTVIASGVRWTLRRQEVVGVAVAPLSSGRITLQAISLYAGDVVNNISFVSGSTAGATLTHTWFCLYSSALAKLGVTSDDTSASWAVNTLKTLTLSSPYTVTTSGLYYIGVVCVGTTMPFFTGNNNFGAVVGGFTPILLGSSSTGQTVPGSAPSTAGALTALQGCILGSVA